MEKRRRKMENGILLDLQGYQMMASIYINLKPFKAHSHAGCWMGKKELKYRRGVKENERKLNENENRFFKNIF